MIQLTPTAVQEIQRICKSRQSPNQYFRLDITQGGCLDWIYQFSLEPEPRVGDHQFTIDGLNILVDPNIHSQLQNLTIDYSEDLMGGGFRFTNPNAKKMCNCGQSFIFQT